MSVPQPLHDEIRRLLWAVRDGELTADDEAKLSAILLNDPEARELYVWYSYLCGSLEWDRSARERQNDECEMMNDELPSQAGIVIDLQDAASIHHSSFNIQHSFVSGILFSYLVATLVLGTALAIAWAWKLPNHVQIAVESVPSPSPLAPSPSFKMQFVGRITGMVDCEWADPHTAVPGPVAVPLGRKYALSAGLLEITYDTGVRVVLQGPCTYEVESKDGGYLSIGKLTARVEKKPNSPRPSDGRGAGGEGRTNGNHNESQNALTLALSQGERGPDSRSSFQIPHSYFAVRTPTATVTDLGTEFGVEVGESGNTLAHVYDGVVEMQPIGRDAQRGQAVRLVKDQSARVEKVEGGAAVTVRDAETAPATFLRVGQLAKVAEELRLKPFRRWQAYSEELRRDPLLVAYYNFQLEDGSPTVLRNVAANGDRSCDGVIENAIWTTGRMPGKQALLFSGPADGVQLNLPQKTADVTLVARVYNTVNDAGLQSILASNGWRGNGQIHWYLRPDDRMGFDIVEEHSTRSMPYCSAPVLHRLQPCRWTHLAVVYDQGSGYIRFYVDGKEAGQAQIDKSDPISIAEARIGQWNPEGYEGAVGALRLFRGKIEELAVFGRPLAADEVRRLCEAGTPEAPSKRSN